MVENGCYPRPSRRLSISLSVFQRARCQRWCKNRLMKFSWHMAKTIRRYVIFSNTWKTYFWKCLRVCVYIYCPSCDFIWRSIRKSRIDNFILFWIHVINGWKMFKHFENSVERINSLQMNWSIITLDVGTSWCWIWNNVISWTPLTWCPNEWFDWWGRVCTISSEFNRGLAQSISLFGK